MKRFLSFLAMSAVVLGMAFTFNACGGNDANNPEPRRFKMNINKVSDTSCKVEIQSPGEDVFFTDGFATSEEFLKDPRGFVQNRLNAYKKESNPTYPEGLHAEVERSLNDLDPETEYVIYVCEVNEEYQAVGNVEHKRVRRGAEVPEQSEEPEDPQIDPNSSLQLNKTVLKFPQRGGTEYFIYVESTAGIPKAKLDDKPWLKITPRAYDEKPYGIDELHHNREELAVEVAAGAPDEATVVFSNDETSVKMVIRRNDSYDPGYEYRNSPSALEGTLSGKFSTGPGSVVYFSKGNLQYHVDNQIWRFAEKQTDVLNKGAYSYADEDEYELEKIWNHDWMDQFYWLCGEYPAEEKYTYYHVVNLHDQDIVPISNGGNKVGIWHSPTKEEWEYLFFGRDRANELFGQGTIDGQKGVFILPDNWVQPAGIPAFTPPNPASWLAEEYNGEISGYRATDDDVKHYADNTYTANEWKTMEERGAVFLPAIYYSFGFGEGGGHDMEAKYQTYYSMYPPAQDNTSYFFLFNNWEFIPQSISYNYNSRADWVSVRLVRIAQP